MRARGGSGAGIITTALITLLGQARIFVVLGRGRLLPEWLAQVHVQKLTPQHATILSAAAAGVPWCAPAAAALCCCCCSVLSPSSSVSQALLSLQALVL